MSKAWIAAIEKAARDHGVAVEFRPVTSDALFFDVVSEYGRRKQCLSGCYLAMQHSAEAMAKEADRAVRLRALEIELDHAARSGV